MLDKSKHYYEQQDYESALSLGPELLDAAEKEFSKESPEYANTLHHIGLQNALLQNSGDAELFFAESISLYETLANEKTKVNHIIALKNLALLYWETQNMPPMKNLAETCLALDALYASVWREVEFVRLVRQVSGYLANNNDYVAAEELLLKGIVPLRAFYKDSDIFSELSTEHYHLLSLLESLMNVNWEMKNFEKTKAVSLEILNIFDAPLPPVHNDNYYIAKVTLGESYLHLNEFSQCEDVCLDLLVSLERDRDELNQPDIELLLAYKLYARLLLFFGELESAEEYVESGIALFGLMENPAKPIAILNELHLIKGVIAVRSGRLGLAEKEYNRVLESMRRNEDYSISQDLQLRLGDFMRDLGNFQEAAILYTRVIDESESFYPYGMNLIHLRALKSIGDLYTRLGNSQGAVYYYSKIERKIQQLSELPYLSYNHEKFIIEFYVASFYYFMSNGEPEIAERYLNRADELSRLQQNPDMIIIKELSMAWIVLFESNGYHEGAVGLREDLIKDTPKSNLRYSTLLIQNGNSYYMLGDYNRAYKYFSNGINSLITNMQDQYPYLSENERASFWYTMKWELDVLFGCCEDMITFKPELSTLLFNTLLKTKNSILRSNRNMRNRILESHDENLIDEFAKWQEQKEQYAYLVSRDIMNEDREIAEGLARSINSREKVLSEKSDIFAGETQEQITNWKDVQESLGPEEAFIDIVRYQYKGEIHYSVLVLTSETSEYPLFHTLEHSRLFESSNENYSGIEQYILTIKDDVSADLRSITAAMDATVYEYFFREISELIGEAKTLYVCPDGVFNKINLESLRGPNGSYLADDYDIHIVLNGDRKIAETRDAIDFAQMTEPVLIGYPDFKFSLDERQTVETGNDDGRGSDELTPLPYTRDEINDIERLFSEKSISTKQYLDKNATEENIKSVAKPSLLHIASHGFFYQNQAEVKENAYLDGSDNKFRFAKDPLFRSGIYLAGADVSPAEETSIEDGILTAYEVSNMNLTDCRLVVLSACETGLGEIANGEGVYGLQRSFLTAGAEAVIMTLWKVSDKATMSIMTYFYTYLLEGMSPEKSLALAKKELRKDYPEGYYWGAFVLIR